MNRVVAASAAMPRRARVERIGVGPPGLDEGREWCGGEAEEGYPVGVSVCYRTVKPGWPGRHRDVTSWEATGAPGRGRPWPAGGRRPRGTGAPRAGRGARPTASTRPAAIGRTCRRPSTRRRRPSISPKGVPPASTHRCRYRSQSSCSPKATVWRAIAAGVGTAVPGSELVGRVVASDRRPVEARVLECGPGGAGEPEVDHVGGHVGRRRRGGEPEHPPAGVGGTALHRFGVGPVDQRLRAGAGEHADRAASAVDQVDEGGPVGPGRAVERPGPGAGDQADRPELGRGRAAEQQGHRVGVVEGGEHEVVGAAAGLRRHADGGQVDDADEVGGAGVVERRCRGAPGRWRRGARRRRSGPTGRRGNSWWTGAAGRGAVTRDNAFRQARSAGDRTVRCTREDRESRGEMVPGGCDSAGRGPGALRTAASARCAAGGGARGAGRWARRRAGQPSRSAVTRASARARWASGWAMPAAAEHAARE